MGHIHQKDFSKKKLLRFNLDALSKKVMNNNPRFMMSYGSNTIPPCSENVIHITIDKPLHVPGCQFKLLRENSLISTRPKEIHTRLEKPDNDRTVYTFNKNLVQYIPNISDLVPMEFNKYLLAHGYGYMYRKGGRYWKNGRWRKGKKGRKGLLWRKGGRGGKGGWGSRSGSGDDDEFGDGMGDTFNCRIPKK